MHTATTHMQQRDACRNNKHAARVHIQHTRKWLIKATFDAPAIIAHNFCPEFPLP